MDAVVDDLFELETGEPGVEDILADLSAKTRPNALEQLVVASPLAHRRHQPPVVFTPLIVFSPNAFACTANACCHLSLSAPLADRSPF
jgi:hypothetical protein